MLHRITSHIIWNASFEMNNLGKGNDILTYDEKGARAKTLGTAALPDDLHMHESITQRQLITFVL